MKKDNTPGTMMISDAVGIIGCGLMTYGSWLVYRPLGFLVLGVILIAGSILWERGNA